MAKEDLLPFKYDSKTNTVFNTSGAKIVPVVRPKPQSKSWLNLFFYIAARLAAWLDLSAPTVCRRFDTIKHNTIPYLKPYYDNYAEPYLARAQPYLQKGQGYYEQFGAPTVAKGQDLWVKQATPRIKKSYTAVRDQYKQKIYPVLDRAVLKKSRDVYSKYLDTHVQRVSSQYTRSVHPHLQSLQKRSYKLYHERVVPAYQATAPRIHYVFRTVENKYATQVEPRVHAVMKWIIRKIEQVVIPRVTIFWGIHVQPQLDRICDKLFRNREAKQAVSTTIGERKTTQTFLSSPVSSQDTEAHPTSIPSLAAVEDEEGEEEEDEMTILLEEEEPKEEPTIVHERPPLDRPVQVDALLEKWRAEIRAVGVETEELFLDAVQEIFQTEKQSEISITNRMVLEFNNTVQSEIASLENTIIFLAKKGRASGKDDPRLKELNKNIVASAKKIRNHAVEIRNHLKTIKGRFEDKIVERRQMAWKIMDEVVGEAQIDIGNLWMWLADITYYDWQEYHGLADMTNTIKQRIHASGAGEHFTIMAEIQESAENKVNTIAKDAANKLAELKEIGREKILLGDDSENFRSGGAPEGIKMTAEDVNIEGSEVVYGSATPSGVDDEVMKGLEKATDPAPSAADNAVTNISEANYVSPQGVLESVVSQTSKAIVGEEPPIQAEVVSFAQDILSPPSDVAADGASKVPSSTIGTPQEPGESIASNTSTATQDTTQDTESAASQVTPVASEIYNSEASYTSEIMDDLPSATDVVDKAKVAGFSVPSLADDALSSASNVAPSTATIAGEGIVIAQDRVQKVFKAPELSVGEKISSIASEAVYGAEPGVAEKETDAADSVSEMAGSKVNQVVYGTEPDVAEKVTDTAIGVGETVASEALYVAEPGIMETTASVASSVVSEASEVIIGTEPGTLEMGTKAAENVNKATLKVTQPVEEASTVASRVASEVTEAIGAATSKVWENKQMEGGYRDEL